MMRECIIKVKIPNAVKNAMARNEDEKTVQHVKEDGQDASIISSITRGTVNT